jgi:FkbM family methyltransferase
MKFSSDCELTNIERTAFFSFAKKRGKIVELIITAFYTELSLNWPEGAVLVDGGANRGYHARRMASLESVERVIAVEASPEVWKAFQAKVARSKKLAKVDLRFAALQNDPAVETVTFQVSTSHPGRSGLNPVMQGLDGTEFGPPQQVPATTLDKLTEGVSERVRFVKLDLEGGEFAALQGGRRTLIEGRSVCVFENGPMTPAMNGYTPNEVLSFFESTGLRVSSIYGDPVTPETLGDFWYAWAFPVEDFEEQTARLRRLVRSALQSPPAFEED